MIINTTAPYGVFILRVALGVMFIAHAGLKIFVYTLAGTVAFSSPTAFQGSSHMPRSSQSLSVV